MEDAKLSNDSEQKETLETQSFEHTLVTRTAW